MSSQVLPGWEVESYRIQNETFGTPVLIDKKRWKRSKSFIIVIFSQHFFLIQHFSQIILRIRMLLDWTCGFPLQRTHHR